MEPAAVIGHSMGEVAAAVVVGGLSLEDGARVICRRSALMARLAGQGAMAVVELGEDAARLELAAERGVSLAVLSSTASSVMSGDAAAVGRLVADWTKREVPASLIQVNVASHSPVVDPILDELVACLVGRAGNFRVKSVACCHVAGSSCHWSPPVR
ncbi:acyltransferase domain-containing protein [Streptomyces lavendulae]|uniref:acyltransferase domain-containing protein n=1 Tax=Streptomyces lavendulae TaxID=1914 RepID=UPI0033C483A1